MHQRTEDNEAVAIKRQHYKLTPQAIQAGCISGGGGGITSSSSRGSGRRLQVTQLAASNRYRESLSGEFEVFHGELRVAFQRVA